MAIRMLDRLHALYDRDETAWLEKAGQVRYCQGGEFWFPNIGPVPLPAFALASRAEAVGLASCGRSVLRVVEHLEQQRRGEPSNAAGSSRDLLRAYHIVRLAAAQEAIAAATARLAAPLVNSGP